MNGFSKNGNNYYHYFIKMSGKEILKCRKCKSLNVTTSNHGPRRGIDEPSFYGSNVHCRDCFAKFTLFDDPTKKGDAATASSIDAFIQTYAEAKPRDQL